MPARPEGSVSLHLNNTLAAAMSLIAVTAMFSGVTSKPGGQPSMAAETSRTLPEPELAKDLGGLATQNNFSISIGTRPLETTTTTSAIQPEATSFSLQISLDQVMNYIMSIANTGVPTVTPAVFAEWNKTHECEEREVYNSHHDLTAGGWYVDNPSLSSSSGGLGIKNNNYLHYLTNPPNLPNLIQLGFPTDQSQATPVEQIIIAERIQTEPPDQNGICKGW